MLGQNIKCKDILNKRNYQISILVSRNSSFQVVNMTQFGYQTPNRKRNNSVNSHQNEILK